LYTQPLNIHHRYIVFFMSRGMAQYYGDDIPFGVTGSNIREAGRFSSTLDEVFVRLHTNDNDDGTGPTTGMVVGAYNTSGVPGGTHELYLGAVDANDVVTPLLTITSNALLPTSNEYYDLGSGDHRFRDMYLSGNSINLGGTLIRRDAGTGAVTFESPTGENILYADNISTSPGSNIINFTHKELSNIATISTDAVTSPTGTIDMTNTALSNIGSIVTPLVVYTDPSAPYIAELRSGNDPVFRLTSPAASLYGRLGLFTSNPQVALEVHATDAVLLPVGTTSQRPPVPATGHVRYNADLQTFEGYHNNTWGSLGGVKSTDGATRITAELAPGTNDGNLRFFTCNIESVRITPTGQVGIGTTAPTATLDVRGPVSIGSTLAVDAVVTPSLQSLSGTLDLNYTNLTRIGDATMSNLTVQGNVNVRGSFIITDTTTCNTDQFYINNDGTGPALIVNQSGTNHITQFMDDSNIVFAVLDGGQAVFGSFGNALPVAMAGDEVAQVGIAAADRRALNVKQLSATQDIAAFRQSTNASKYVVIDSNAHIGIGTQPTAIFEAIKDTGNVDFIRYASTAFVIDTNGHVGISAAPHTSHLLNAGGTIAADGLTTYALQSPTAIIDCTNNTFSNVATVRAATVVVNQITAAANNTVDMTNVSLSNVTNIHLASISGTSAEGLINLSQTTLSNASNVLSANATITNLAVANLSPVATATVINLGTAGLSNVGNLDLASFTCSTAGAPIDGRQTTLSNLAAVAANTARIATLTPLTGTVIDLDSNDLSNIASIQLTSFTSPTTVVDGSQSTLCNLNRVNVTNVAATHVATDTLTGLSSTFINALGSTLSNLNTLNVGTVVTDSANVDALVVNTLTSTNPINFAGSTISNITNINFASLTAVGGLPINAFGSMISNVVIDALSVTTPTLTSQSANLTNIQIASFSSLTGPATPINAQQSMISNLAAINTTDFTTTTATAATVTVENLTTVGTAINLNAKSLSNVADISLASFSSAAGAATPINANQTTLSNLAKVSATSNVADVAVATKLVAPTAVLDTIQTTRGDATLNYSGLTLSNISTLRTAALAGPGTGPTPTVIDGTQSTVSNLAAVAATTLTTSTLTTTAAAINLASNHVSNVGRLSVAAMDAGGAAAINVSATSLNNVNALSATTVAAGAYTPLTGTTLNFAGNSLSNIATVDMSAFRSTAGAGVVDGLGSTLSNLAHVKAATLTTNTLTSTGASIALDGRSLTGVANVAMSSFTGNGSTTINGSGSTLSNLAAVSTTALTATTATVATLTSAGATIDVNAKNLSNVGTLSLVALAPMGAANINVSAATLSNINDVQTASLTATTVRAATLLPATGAAVSLGGCNLTAVGELSVTKLTSPTGTINMSQSILNNINETRTDTVVATTATLYNTTIDTLTTLNARGIHLVGTTLSNVGRLDVATITPAGGTGVPINLSGGSLSNVNAIAANTLTIAAVTSANATIDFSSKSVSNINAVTATTLSSTTVNNTGTATTSVLSVGQITSSGASIDFSSKSVSNVDVVTATTLSSSTLNNTGTATTSVLSVGQVTSSGATIDFSSKSLSNVNAVTATTLASTTLNNTGTATTSILSVGQVTSSGATIDFSSKGLSNIGALNAASLTATNIASTTLSNAGTAYIGALGSATGAAINAMGVTLSNIGSLQTESFTTASFSTAAFSTTTLTTANIASAAPSIAMTSALRIQGQDTGLYAAVGATFGTSTCNARIGLRVDYNILSGAFLSFSDRRLKEDIVASDATVDLDAVLAIPVRRFRFKEVGGDAAPTVGFIAQEVEAVAPYAVRTTFGALPDVMVEADVAAVVGKAGGQTMTLYLEEPGESAILPGEYLKIVGKKDAIVEVVRTSAGVVVVAPVSAADDLADLGTHVLIYGHYVPDVKVIDTDRLLPLAFNAVQKVYKEMREMEVVMERLSARLAAVEALAKP
jgi:hypothetical protein